MESTTNDTKQIMKRENSLKMGVNAKTRTNQQRQTSVTDMMTGTRCYVCHLEDVEDMRFSRTKG